MSGCCVIYDDFDGPEFFNRAWRKARKEHRCCECYETIKKGERYIVSTGKWEDGIQSFKTCRVCAAIIEEYFGGIQIFERMEQQFIDCKGFSYIDNTQHSCIGCAYETGDWINCCSNPNKCIDYGLWDCGTETEDTNG